MKKTPLRRKSKSKRRKLIDKADRALQDFYRTQGLVCEVCGKPMNVVHHYFPKNQSSYLRFKKENLVPICTSCHFKHHRTGDPTIHDTIKQKRGQKWLDDLVHDFHDNHGHKLSDEYLIKQIEKYDTT